MFLDDNEEDGDLLDTPSLTEGSNSIETELHNHQSLEDEHFLTFASDSTTKQPFTIHRDDLFAGHQHRESLLSKCEHVLAASKLTSTDLSLEECYKLCGVPFLEDQSTARSKMEVTPPETPRKDDAEQVRVPGSGNSSSTLSSVPSDLEEWDVEVEGKVEIDGNSWKTQTDVTVQKTEGHAAIRNIPQESASPSKPPSRLRSKTATRGVAQRIQRGANKTPVIQSSPVRKSSGGMKDKTLLALHSGSFRQDDQGRRRSVRHAMSEGNK
jgi:hypothetical protein